MAASHSDRKPSQLIPWDHHNAEHVERMYQQRVACGWRAEEVPDWVEDAKKGGKLFYWIVSGPDVDGIEEWMLAQMPSC